MKPKKTKQQQIEVLKQKARDLSIAGYTTREVGKMIKKSHAWVALVVKDRQGLDKGSCI
jgi:ribosomal protein S17E